MATGYIKSIHFFPLKKGEFGIEESVYSIYKCNILKKATFLTFSPFLQYQPNNKCHINNQNEKSGKRKTNNQQNGKFTFLRQIWQRFRTLKK
jgi:hypothetical protein